MAHYNLTQQKCDGFARQSILSWTFPVFFMQVFLRWHRMRRTNLMILCKPDFFVYVDVTDYFSYTDMEIAAFKSIMRLERGFRTIVSACTGDIRYLLALINKVCT